MLKNEHSRCDPVAVRGLGQRWASNAPTYTHSPAIPMHSALSPAPRSRTRNLVAAALAGAPLMAAGTEDESTASGEQRREMSARYLLMLTALVENIFCAAPCSSDGSSRIASTARIARRPGAFTTSSLAAMSRATASTCCSPVQHRRRRSADEGVHPFSGENAVRLVSGSVREVVRCCPVCVRCVVSDGVRKTCPIIFWRS